MPSYEVEDCNPANEFDDSWAALTLEEAAHRMDDLTGVGADVILADWDEPCATCKGAGRLELFGLLPICSRCNGDGKRSEPWEWTDDETGREVTMTKVAD